TWSCTAWDVLDTVTSAHSTTGLPDGSYTLSASETSANGNPQAASAAQAGFQVKFQPTAAPALSLPAFVGLAGPNGPAASGTGEASDAVVVSASGSGVTASCSGVSVASGGGWSCSSWSVTGGPTASSFPEGTFT